MRAQDLTAIKLFLIAFEIINLVTSLLQEIADALPVNAIYRVLFS